MFDTRPLELGGAPPGSLGGGGPVQIHAVWFRENPQAASDSRLVARCLCPRGG